MKAPDILMLSNDIAAALDVGVRTLGQRNGAVLTFAFDLLDERIRSDALLNDETLLACLDQAMGTTALPNRESSICR